MYTQCPSCRTLFRISEQQLAVAKGKVRCGKCNHIYNAQGTLIDDLPQQAPAAAPVNQTKPLANKKNTVDLASSTEVVADINIAPTEQPEDDDWLFGDDDDFGSDELSDDDIPSITPAGDVGQEDWQMVNLGADSDITSDDSSDHDSGYDDDDDDWLFGDESDDDVDLILREEDDEVPETVTPKPQPGNEEDEEEDSDFMRHMSDYLDEDKADELISDESASGILDELNEQLSTETGRPGLDDKKDARTPGDWFDNFDEVMQSSESSDEENEKQELNDAILNNLGTAPSPTPEPEPQQPLISELTTEPLTDNPFAENESIVLEETQEPDTGHKIGQHDDIPLRLRDSIGIEEQEPRSGSKWLAIIGSIAALIFLFAAQAILFRSADLAYAYPDFQPTLIKLCQNLPCRDSRRYDVHEIDLMSRNINQHPKTKSALLIKAAIINRAEFAQRYPKIKITLSDVTGDTVAQRIFYPQEYLGELYDPFLQMKPNTPIHIALEVMDPGSSAINFEFKFL